MPLHLSGFDIAQNHAWNRRYYVYLPECGTAAYTYADDSAARVEATGF
jgi:hypothetical protein